MWSIMPKGWETHTGLLAPESEIKKDSLFRKQVQVRWVHNKLDNSCKYINMAT